MSPFHSAKFLKNSQSRSRVIRISHFRAQNEPFVKFFWYKPLLLLSSTYWPFSLCKIQKKFLQRIQSYEDEPFVGPKWSIGPKHFFFLKKLLISISSTYWPLSWCKIFKKFLPRIQSSEDAPFLGQKWLICPNENFFSENLLISLVPFIHAYLHAKNQSQILIY